MKKHLSKPAGVTRRRALQVAVVTAGGAAALLPGLSSAQLPQSLAQPDFKITKGRIRQSIMGWFNFSKIENIVNDS